LGGDERSTLRRKGRSTCCAGKKGAAGEERPMSPRAGGGERDRIKKKLLPQNIALCKRRHSQVPLKKPLPIMECARPADKRSQRGGWRCDETGVRRNDSVSEGRTDRGKGSRGGKKRTDHARRRPTDLWAAHQCIVELESEIEANRPRKEKSPTALTRAYFKRMVGCGGRAGDIVAVGGGRKQPGRERRLVLGCGKRALRRSNPCSAVLELGPSERVTQSCDNTERNALWEGGGRDGVF